MICAAAPPTSTRTKALPARQTALLRVAGSGSRGHAAAPAPHEYGTRRGPTWPLREATELAHSSQTTSSNRRAATGVALASDLGSGRDGHPARRPSRGSDWPPERAAARMFHDDCGRALAVDRVADRGAKRARHRRDRYRRVREQRPAREQPTCGVRAGRSTDLRSASRQPPVFLADEHVADDHTRPATRGKRASRRR